LLPRARAVTLLNYPDLARALGVDPYAILARAELRASVLGDVENWLPGKQILEVLEETARSAGRDDFGVLLGEFRSFASLGPVSLLLKHEVTLQTVIEAMIEYRRLLNELLHLKLDQQGDDALLIWSLIPGLRSSQGVNLLATIAYRVLVDWTAVGWQPDCIHFRHAAPANREAFNRVFRCPIEFDSEFDGLSFRTRSLELGNAFADAELAAHARTLLNLMPGVRRPESTSERARATIALMLPKGEANVSSVSRSLGLTVRSLQRRLDLEQLTFSTLLNDVRRELAARYLRDSAHSSTAIAELTGFSALSSFSRWFATEFAMSPRDWKRLWKSEEQPIVPTRAVGLQAEVRGAR